MDPVRTEVMRNRFAAIAAEASYVAYRCAHTTFVKEVQDYQVAVAGLSGEFFAFPTESGTSGGVCHNLLGLVDCIGKENLAEGDIIISNDPYSGNAICTHSMDVNLLMPIFCQGTLIAYAWAFIHASDIGGSVPGSVHPTNYEIYQEGLRITPTFMYRKGEFNEPLWRIFADNTRIPDLIWGDLQAMIAGLKLLETRLCAICDRYGMAATLQSIEDVLDLAEQKALQALRTLKNGTYVGHDYLEGYNQDGHIFICTRMTVEDGAITLDFAGSDPQVNYAMNFPSGSGRAHHHLCYLLVQYIRTIEPTVPVNGGMVRAIRTLATKGSIVNAEFPAAGGNRAITSNRCYDAVLACLNQAVEGGFAAAGSGVVGVISVSSLNDQTGLRHVSVVQPFLGGGGGQQGRDGANGVHMSVAFLKTVPVETVEQETQLVVRHFGFETDSAGAGQFRGGASFRLDLQNTRTPSLLACRGLDRFRFQPWGIGGGACGRRAEVTLNPDTPAVRSIGKIEILELLPGDLLRMISPSGGGCGDPMARPVDAVVSDVRNGLVSPEQAQQQYGVAIRGSGATITGIRAVAPRGADTGRPPEAAFGETRAAVETIWPPEVSAALANRILAEPPGIRRFWMDRVRHRLAAKNRTLTVDDVNAEIERLKSPLPALAAD